MDFYTTLSRYYEDIFPADFAQRDAVKRITGLERGVLADVGCGAGGLSRLLVSSGFEVTGIDSDEGMIARAKELSVDYPNSRFLCADMRTLKNLFHPGELDGVVCFGNTLVHLERDEDCKRFFRDASTVLKQDGMVVFQILNYDMLREKMVSALPVLENNRIRFERYYDWKNEREISFRTRLVVKEENAAYENTIRIFPRYRKELESMMAESGFSSVTFCGGFNGEELSDNSFVLVSSGKKSDGGLFCGNQRCLVPDSV